MTAPRAPVTPVNRKTLAARFWPKVNKDGPTIVAALGPCWVWAGARDRNGYGLIYVARMARSASRTVWFLETGEWPDLFVLHKCDGGPLGCVRPSHLFLGTNADNIADMLRKGRSARGKHHKARRRGALAIELVDRFCDVRQAGGDVAELARSLGIKPDTAQTAIRRRLASRSAS